MTTTQCTIREAKADDFPAMARALAWAIEWRSSTLSASAGDVVHRTGHDYLL